MVLGDLEDDLLNQKILVSKLEQGIDQLDQDIGNNASASTIALGSLLREIFPNHLSDPSYVESNSVSVYLPIISRDNFISAPTILPKDTTDAPIICNESEVLNEISTQIQNISRIDDMNDMIDTAAISSKDVNSGEMTTTSLTLPMSPVKGKSKMSIWSALKPKSSMKYSSPKTAFQNDRKMDNSSVQSADLEKTWIKLKYLSNDTNVMIYVPLVK